MEFRGVWWNVWLEARDKPNGAQQIADKVARLIKEHDLDWICLQEVFRYDYWGKAGDVVRLIEKTTGWHGFFAAGSQYHYEKSISKAGSNYTDGIATFSKWPIKSNNIITLGPWAKGQKVGLEGRRMLLETTLETPAGQIIAGNTHWTRIHHQYRSHRRSEMKIFYERISSLKTKTPYVVGGDFNTLPSHKIIKTLGQYLDLRTGTARKPTWLHTGKQRGILRCNLDYVGVLKNSGIEFVDFQLLNRQPSDHAPLLGQFIVGK